MAEAASPPPVVARRVMRATDRATLATLMPPAEGASGGAPYASLVLVALDHDATPLLLVSTLAEHTRNFRADPRIALLFDGTAGLAEPLTGPRVSIVGTIAESREPRQRLRYLARHPSAALYAGFRDFALYRVAVERAHLVAGFGMIHWLEADQVLAAPAPSLAAAESELLAECARDLSALERALDRQNAGAGGGFQPTGIDPDGIDLRRGGEVARLAFDAAVSGAAAARAAIRRLLGEEA